MNNDQKKPIESSGGMGICNNGCGANASTGEPVIVKGCAVHDKNNTQEWGLGEAIRDICDISVTAAPKSRVKEILNKLLASHDKATLERVIGIIDGMRLDRGTAHSHSPSAKRIKRYNNLLTDLKNKLTENISG